MTFSLQYHYIMQYIAVTPTSFLRWLHFSMWSLRSVMNHILECENVSIWTTKPVENGLHGHCKFSFYAGFLLKGTGDIIFSNIFWTYSFCKHLTRQMFCNTKGKLNRLKPPPIVGLTIPTFTDFVTF